MINEWMYNARIVFCEWCQRLDGSIILFYCLEANKEETERFDLLFPSFPFIQLIKPMKHIRSTEGEPKDRIEIRILFFNV